MELNDCVKVILTQRGADIVNTVNSGYKERAPILEWKTDYKAGDTYKTELWDICAMFGPFSRWGAEATFTQLEKDK